MNLGEDTAPVQEVSAEIHSILQIIDRDFQVKIIGIVLLLAFDSIDALMPLFISLSPSLSL